MFLRFGVGSYMIGTTDLLKRGASANLCAPPRTGACVQLPFVRTRRKTFPASHAAIGEEVSWPSGPSFLARERLREVCSDGPCVWSHTFP